jgi:hypothetical protein
LKKRLPKWHKKARDLGENPEYIPQKKPEPKKEPRKALGNTGIK